MKSCVSIILGGHLEDVLNLPFRKQIFIWFLRQDEKTSPACPGAMPDTGKPGLGVSRGIFR